MKKLILVYVILIIAVILLAVTRSGGNILSMLPFRATATAEVDGAKINLIVVKSAKDSIKGLSGRKNLEQNRGMLFVFEKKDKYPFWMKGMNFPLDIIFIDDATVVDLYENVQPSKNSQNLIIYRPEKPANFVLEVNSGEARKLKIKKGTKITLKNIK